MKRIVATIVVFCFATGLLFAGDPVTKGVVIDRSEIQAAAKAVVEDSMTQDEPERPPNAPTGMSSGAVIAIILVVVVIAGVLYLADQNDSEHGGGGIFAARAQRATPTQYQHRFLRQQWQPR